MLKTVTDGKVKDFEYDTWGNLSKTVFEDGKVEHRAPDKTGNLFERLDRMDRKYAAGGQLVKTENWEYKYDKEGNLVRKRDKHGQTWRYEWNAAGMLASVKRPDAQEVTFKYDALGRRIEKCFRNIVTRWVWDGNTPLHEDRESWIRDWEEGRGEFRNITKYPLVTWVFEEGTFVPAAKITEKEKLSIVTNYLGTPEAMFREDGEKVWTCELNSYGKVRNFQGESKTMCNWRFQGQYEDSETGLYYNRMRYYSPDEGIYLSQDPIGVEGGIKLYGYVHDTNSWLDVLGLSCKKHGNRKGKQRAEGYTLRDRNTGEIKKFGETTRGERKYGNGKQRRYTKKYLDDNNVDYVKEKQGSKNAMHKWQHDNIVEFKKNNNGNRPNLNKSDY